jgi:hypothetical protein
VSIWVCGGRTSVVTTDEDPLPQGLPGMETRKDVQYGSFTFGTLPFGAPP